MLHWMLKLICDLSPLCSECLTACTHSLNPQVLKEIGPSYAACLMLEMKQKKLEEEELHKRKHTRHSEAYCKNNNNNDNSNSNNDSKPVKPTMEQHAQTLPPPSSQSSLKEITFQ